MAMNPYPHELQFGDVYISPWIVVIVLAFVFSTLTAMILNKLKLSKLFLAHHYLFLAMMVLYMVFIDNYLIKVF